MDTPVLCNPPISTVINSAIRYSPPSGNGAAASSQTQRMPIAEAGTFSAMVVRLAAALTTGSLTVTLQVGTGGGVPADTAMTLTFNAGDQVKVYGGSPISVSAGDEVMIKWSPTSTPDISNLVALAFVFTATASGKSQLFCSHSATAAATFVALGSSPANATESNVAVICPTDGVISKIYARRSAAPGAGAAYTYTLRKGATLGAMADTALSVTISTTAVANNATASVSVSAGDFLSIGGVPSSPTAPASGIGLIALDWAPTVDGEALLFAVANSGASSSANRFIVPNGQVPQATEADAYSIAPMAFTMKKLYGRVTTAPGSGKSWTDTLMIAGAAQTLVASVADTNTVLTPDTTHSDSVASQALIDMRIAPSGTPTAYGAMGLGMVAYTGVAATGGGGMLLMGAG